MERMQGIKKSIREPGRGMGKDKYDHDDNSGNRTGGSKGGVSAKLIGYVFKSSCFLCHGYLYYLLFVATMLPSGSDGNGHRIQAGGPLSQIWSLGIICPLT